MLYTGIEHLSLMTYGWAILIIAVVLGALFQLGIFNASNFAVKAPPGSCQAYRPNGPGTTVQGLEGECINALPQYVAQFNGATSNVVAPGPLLPNSITQFSESVWIYVSSEGSAPVVFTVAGESSDWVIGICNGYSPCAPNNGLVTAAIGLEGGGNANTGSNSIPLNTWVNIVGTYDNGATTIYLNGFPDGTYPNLNLNVNGAPTGIVIGSGGGNSFFTGDISNVQIYNVTFTAAEANALYTEGIGGAPVKPQNLVGWWPLNGNANDYSGNNNNGAATSVTYSGSWSRQYAGPV